MNKVTSIVVLGLVWATTCLADDPDSTSNPYGRLLRHI